jgi:hypothetical protein
MRRRGNGRTSLYAALAVVGLACAAIGVLACASTQETRLRNVQVTPSLQPSRLRNVATMAITPNQETRQRAEGDLAARIQRLGTQAVASTSVLGAQPPATKDELREALLKSGVEAVLVGQFVGKDTQQKVVGTQTVGGPAFVGPGYGMGGLYGYYGWAGPTYTEPVVRDQTTLVLQFRLFRVEGDGQLLWSAQSQTIDPGQQDEVIAQVNEAVVTELARSGFIGH